jgi:hypothetical protein
MNTKENIGNNGRAAGSQAACEERVTDNFARLGQLGRFIPERVGAMAGRVVCMVITGLSVGRDNRRPPRP